MIELQTPSGVTVYVNVDFVSAVVERDETSAHIYMHGISQPFVIGKPAGEIVKILAR